MLPSPLRRTVLLALTGLAAGLVPLVVTTAPTHASTSCKSEKPGLLGATCDDEKPPSRPPPAAPSPRPDRSR